MDLAAVVLAAGSGTRLRPLTELLPKALCPVNNIALVDHAVSRAQQVTSSVAVNAWHQADKVKAHIADRVYLSMEQPDALGTAGALGRLKDWIDGQPTLVQNADAFHAVDPGWFVEGWDGLRPRLLVVDTGYPSDFGSYRFCGMSLLPWQDIRDLEAQPSGLYEVLWARQWEAGQIEVRVFEGPYFDCGTPADYLAANLMASGGESVIGAGAVVEGTVDRCVLWPGVHVAGDEELVEVIRPTDDITIDVNAPEFSTW